MSININIGFRHLNNFENLKFELKIRYSSLKFEIENLLFNPKFATKLRPLSSVGAYASTQWSCHVSDNVSLFTESWRRKTTMSRLLGHCNIVRSRDWDHSHAALVLSRRHNMFVGVSPPRGVIPTEYPEPWILNPGFQALQLRIPVPTKLWISNFCGHWNEAVGLKLSGHRTDGS